MNHKVPWLGGFLLIFLGLVFLFNNLGLVRLPGNWWAMFIMLPSFASWYGAWHQYSSNGGHFTRSAIGALTWGSLPFLIGLIFLFNLNWGLFWPLILIFAGVSALINVQASKNGEEHSEKSVE
jgi:hypothetical protein